MQGIRCRGGNPLRAFSLLSPCSSSLGSVTLTDDTLHRQRGAKSACASHRTWSRGHPAQVNHAKVHVSSVMVLSGHVRWLGTALRAA